MRDVNLCLDFECCGCGQPVRVTVRCSGLIAGGDQAAVSVPCPECGFISRLCFDPDGTVRSVDPTPRGLYPVPAPSAN